MLIRLFCCKIVLVTRLGVACPPSLGRSTPPPLSAWGAGAGNQYVAPALSTRKENPNHFSYVVPHTKINC